MRIRPSRSWRCHVPGQFIRVGVDVDGVRHWRAYSLTSRTDSPDGLISITVKAVPAGVVSSHAVRSLRPGALLHLEQATGEFVLGGYRGPTLFLTAGSGITPVMGILRNHLHELGDVVLVPDSRARHTWACGPAAMLDAFEGKYATAGLG